MTDPEVPEELRDPFRTAASPYAVPLGTLVAGAYVPVTEQVELQPTSAFEPVVASGPVLGGGDDD